MRNAWNLSLGALPSISQAAICYPDGCVFLCFGFRIGLTGSSLKSPSCSAGIKCTFTSDVLINYLPAFLASNFCCSSCNFASLTTGLTSRFFSFSLSGTQKRLLMLPFRPVSLIRENPNYKEYRISLFKACSRLFFQNVIIQACYMYLFMGGMLRSISQKVMGYSIKAQMKCHSLDCCLFSFVCSMFGDCFQSVHEKLVFFLKN